MSTHRWRFARIGGFDQVQLATGADLVALKELDQKLWVALACPVKSVEFDARTLDLIDTDRDGRVRAQELIDATTWMGEVLVDAEVLVEGDSKLRLASIDVESKSGKLLLDTTKALLKSLGKSDAKEISVEDVDKALVTFANEPANGDGVVPVDAASDDATKKAIADVIACTTPGKDRSGKDAVGRKHLDAFFADVAAHAAWLKKLDEDAAARPLGDATADAHAALAAVRAKIDDYFVRCELAAFDARSQAAMNRDEKVYAELAAKELVATTAEIAALPLAQAAPGKPLPLADGLNPAWIERLAAFRTRAVVPILGARTTLSEADWKSVREKLAPYDAWLAAKKGASVEKLGKARVLELAAPEVRAKIDALVAEDEKAEPLAKAVDSVERLVRYHRDLMRLANNFVAFRDFYAQKSVRAGSPAIFQAGVLYIDTRACELCVRVTDAGKHATMAPLANTFLMYCDCKNAKGESMTIAAAMTAGDVDNLMVGRNGVFYDRKGQGWDATITRIVDNPISIRQAFWAPYKKVVRLAEEQIAKRAADADAASNARLTTAVETTDQAVMTGSVAPPPPPRSPRKPLDIGVVAALGVAVGGITAALGAFLQAMFGLGFWMPLGVVGLMLAISGPSMAIAWLKLRKRNLGPILDANGWAVNALAKVNIPLGGELTQVATLPKGSTRDLDDPYKEKSRRWRFYLVVFLLALVALAAGWYVGKLDKFLPLSARSVTVLGVNAPAYAPPARERAAPAAAPAH